MFNSKLNILNLTRGIVIKMKIKNNQNRTLNLKMNIKFKFWQIVHLRDASLATSSSSNTDVAHIDGIYKNKLEMWVEAIRQKIDSFWQILEDRLTRRSVQANQASAVCEYWWNYSGEDSCIIGDAVVISRNYSQQLLRLTFVSKEVSTENQSWYWKYRDTFDCLHIENSKSTTVNTSHWHHQPSLKVWKQLKLQEHRTQQKQYNSKRT